MVWLNVERLRRWLSNVDRVVEPIVVFSLASRLSQSLSTASLVLISRWLLVASETESLLAGCSLFPDSVDGWAGVFSFS